VLRVPSSAITPMARRVHWVEADTRQAFFHAVVTNPSRIDITTRWARRLTVYLHDRLVNLDAPVEIWVNGAKVFAGAVPRSAATALRHAKARGDERLIDAAEVTVTVPVTDAAAAAGERAFAALTPKHPEGTLSFWETFAMRALEERVPAFNIVGAEEPLPAGVTGTNEQVAIRVQQAGAGPLSAAGLLPGDLLLEVGGEPFFRGRGGLDGLHAWLMRELRVDPAPYPCRIVRGGRQIETTATLKLGSYGGS
jgi:hypothetical protein